MALATAMLGGLAQSSVGTAQTPTTTAPLPPPGVTPPPAPQAVRADQDGPRLDAEWTSTAVGAPRPGERLCTMLRGPGAPGTPLLCVRGTTPYSAVLVRGTTTTVLPGALVRRTGRTSVAVNVAGDDIGLVPGALRLIPMTADGVPDRRTAPLELTWRRAVQTGCVRAGAGQVSRGPAAGRMVALTFDDGPSTATPAVLDLLKRYDVHATFFVLGSSSTWNPRMLRRIVDEGHSLGVHSWDHARFPSWSDMRRARNAVTSITGVTPCLFRPPYGLTNGRVVADANSLGMTSVMWSSDTNDWQRRGVDSIARAALRVGPGGIILMHDGGGPRGQTVAALSTVIPRLKARGLEPVTVETLLRYRPEYTLR